MKIINSPVFFCSIENTSNVVKRTFLTVTFATVFALNFLNAQHFNCATTQVNDAVANAYPEVLETKNVLEDFARRFKVEYGQSSAARSGKLIIPIVFHIIHNLGSEKITDAQVYDQIRILNEDFNKLNADTAIVIPEFQNIIGNIGVEFRLAKLDPKGNPTTGIEHIPAMQTNDGRDNAKLNPWPRERYLNVWVVRSMESGVAGYAYLPFTVNGVMQTVDGVIILQQYIGSIGTANAYRSRALTHEIGHYLNLPHTWGGNNQPEVSCGDDGVDDTPITRGSTSCKLNKRECDLNVVENVQNFMDYSYCSVMFTEGQKLRMLATLNNSISNRDMLWSQNNLEITGVADGLVVPEPKLIAIGGNLKKFACIDEPVRFVDVSYNGKVDYREWTFENGDVQTSYDSVVTVRFNKTGWQKAKLLVGNLNGESVYEETKAVYVSESDVVVFDQLYEGFEDPATADLWTTVKYFDAKSEFSRTNVAARGGHSSFAVNNYKKARRGDVTELISPAMDLSQMSNLAISFQYALASANELYYLAESSENVSVDSIRVFFSTDCGNTWIALYRMGGPDIVNGGYQLSEFVPPAGVGYYWKQVNFFAQSNIKKPNVRIKFQYKASKLSNNFYIDNINIGGAATAIDETQNVSVVASVVPNPVSGKSALVFSLENDENIIADVIDMSGKIVANIFDGMLHRGANSIEIDAAELPAAGVYHVRFTTAKSVSNTRFVVAR